MALIVKWNLKAEKSFERILFYRFDKKQLIVLNLFDNRKKPKRNK